MYRRDSSPTCVASLQHLKVTSETPGLRHLFAALDLLNIALDFVANVVRCALQCRGGKSSRPSSAKSKKDAFDMTRLLPCDPEEICILAEQVSSSLTRMFAFLFLLSRQVTQSIYSPRYFNCLAVSFAGVFGSRGFN